MPACQTLTELAVQTWTHMSYQARNGFRLPDERAFTDHNMVEFAIRHQSAVRIRLFTTNQEADTGADWHWWFTDGSRALSLLVQAKKLDGTAYAHLDHVIAGSGRRQIDLLIDACTTGTTSGDTSYVGSEPIYVFYNGDFAPGGYPADRCGNSIVSLEARGCAIARALEVRATLDASPGAPHKDINSIVPLTWPWRCFFCCAQVSSGISIVDRVAAMLGGHGDRERWEPASEQVPEHLRVWRRSDIPVYVQRMATNEMPEDPDEVVRAFGEPPPAAARVAVFYEQPGSGILTI